MIFSCGVIDNMLDDLSNPKFSLNFQIVHNTEISIFFFQSDTKINIILTNIIKYTSGNNYNIKYIKPMSVYIS